MTTVTDIGTLITINPELRNGRPVISGTGTSVRRIAILYNQGCSPDAIARRLNHLNLTQIYAALTYYHANRTEIDQDILAEEKAYTELSQIHAQNQ